MAAIEGYGLTISGATAGALGYIVEGEIPGIAVAGKIDTTVHGSTGYKTSIPTSLKEVPDTTVTLLMDATQHATLLSNVGVSQVWTFTDSDGNATTCTGWISAVKNESVKVDDAIRQTITMSFTGGLG
jgi:hypothetical protein